MKRKLTLISLLLLGVILGVTIERGTSLSKLVYHDPYLVFPKRTSLHYCLCIEENPERYNELLDKAEKINDELAEETARFLEKRGLMSSDLAAVIQVNRNGNTTTRVWCSNRTPEVTNLGEEYFSLVEKYDARYDTLLSSFHPRVDEDENDAAE